MLKIHCTAEVMGYVIGNSRQHISSTRGNNSYTAHSNNSLVKSLQTEINLVLLKKLPKKDHLCCSKKRSAVNEDSTIVA